MTGNGRGVKAGVVIGRFRQNRLSRQQLTRNLIEMTIECRDVDNGFATDSGNSEGVFSYEPGRKTIKCSSLSSLVQERVAVIRFGENNFDREQFRRYLVKSAGGRRLVKGGIATVRAEQQVFPRQNRRANLI